MAAIFGKRKNFWELRRVCCIYTLWVNNFAEIALSRTVQEIQAILSFTIFVKNSKIQNGRHFWKEEQFLKIEQSILHVYPVGQKFCWNRSISHGLGDTSNFKFYYFCQKFENLKWLPFLDRGKFFLKNVQSILLRYPMGQKFCQKNYLWWTLHECIVFPQISVQTFKFLPFLSKNTKFKMAAIFGEKNFFWNWAEYLAEIPCGSKISSKSLYLARFRSY